MTNFAGVWLTAVSVFAVAAPVHQATAADAADRPVLVATLLDLPVPRASAATPIAPVQAKTCGCTPQGKQKIIMKVNGMSASAANIHKIRDALNTLPSGGEFKVTVLRAGQVLELTGKMP